MNVRKTVLITHAIFLIAEVDEGSSSDSEQEQEQQKRVKPSAFQFSDDEDDTKRVVRTLKDKRFDEMQSVIKQMKNHKKIRDMAKGTSLLSSILLPHPTVESSINSTRPNDIVF